MNKNFKIFFTILSKSFWKKKIKESKSWPYKKIRKEKYRDKERCREEEEGKKVYKDEKIFIQFKKILTKKIYQIKSITID